ncbi:hypothetical protein Rumal_1353 [Ruminococcus albus 7 = DSM 20455]|uniref:Uncharacterized protein n=1 Tax=Ruminococcus albus (strain ATCC 27210 / DSM 20455 / JCM 14654 / NCDO 2250 / 7) TaxID=697329 RepID=E6UFG3_RUMA7|nr:hypothetical protein Rumal_1353 [Ruminococcus albus 7 = DSM 20455]
MKIPNKLLELSRNELMVACRLYSIVNRHTKLTTNGYIKQHPELSRVLFFHIYGSMITSTLSKSVS